MKSILLFAVLLLPAASSAQDPAKDALVRRLLDHVYRMEFDQAERIGLALASLDPKDPYGPFSLSVVSMLRFVYESEQADLEQLADYERRTEAAIRASKEWLAEHPDDAERYMLLGASYGIAARTSALRHRWIQAYLQARKAIKYTRKADRLDPELGDPLLGIGMYDYYTDTYPRFVGVLARLLLHGDRERGIQRLKAAAEKGRYVNTAAKMLLVEVYTEDRYGAASPEEAIRIMAEVREAYPRSLMLHAAQLVAFYSAERYEDALTGTDEFIRTAEKSSIAANQTAKGRHIRGTTLWAMGRHQQAIEELRESADIRHNGTPTRWGVWSRIRLARLLDLEGRREEALEQYRTAAKEPDLWDLRVLAKQGISEPWKDVHPGGISPL